VCDRPVNRHAGQVASVVLCDAGVRLLPTSANGGPLCLEVARGRLIAVMDSDDMMYPERLKHLITAAEFDGADIAADDLLVFDAADYVRANTLFSGGRSLGYLKPLIWADLDRKQRSSLRHQRRGGDPGGLGRRLPERYVITPIAVMPVAEPQRGRDRSVLFVGATPPPTSMDCAGSSTRSGRLCEPPCRTQAC
jgi:Glycosyl transferase family 2